METDRMTCIVGLVDKEKVFIGGDSASSSASNVFVRKDPKVFKNGEFIIGCTSSFRMIQLLRYTLKPPEVGSKEIYEYMCTDFINAVRQCFRCGGYSRKIDEVEEGGFFLVGYKDRLFRIEEDFQVGETLNGMDAVGCGGDFALGSLYSTVGTPEEKVLKALEAAEFLSTGVRRPFIILET